MAEEENKIILYTTDDGKSQVSSMSRDGRVCRTKDGRRSLLRLHGCNDRVAPRGR